MGQRFDSLSHKHQQFIAAQSLFFVGTAGASGRVNISPKGMNSLRVMGPNSVRWLNVTGSGNETAAHVAENPRMTVMFAAFEGAPMILRLYGTARAVHQADPEWSEWLAAFGPVPGARQVFELSIELVQTSCGMAVPLLDYRSDREELNEWARKLGPHGVQRYWSKKNQVSIDGKPTGILSKSGVNVDE